MRIRDFLDRSLSERTQLKFTTEGDAMRARRRIYSFRKRKDARADWAELTFTVTPAPDGAQWFLTGHRHLGPTLDGEPVAPTPPPPSPVDSEADDRAGRIAVALFKRQQNQPLSPEEERLLSPEEERQ